MSSLILKTCFDYADEFDVVGMALYETETFDKALAALKELWTKNPSFSYGTYFGTNEELQIDSFAEYERGIITKPISEDTLYELGTFCNMGKCIGPEDILDSLRSHLER